MINSIKPINDATPVNDVSVLKLPNYKVYSLKEIYVPEVNNIVLLSGGVKYE